MHDALIADRSYKAAGLSAKYQDKAQQHESLLHLGVSLRSSGVFAPAFYRVRSPELLFSSLRKGVPEFFSFSSSRAVQSQSPQAQGSEPFSSRHLHRSWASCTFTSSKYSSQ